MSLSFSFCFFLCVTLSVLKRKANWMTPNNYRLFSPSHSIKWSDSSCARVCVCAIWYVHVVNGNDCANIIHLISHTCNCWFLCLFLFRFESIRLINSSNCERYAMEKMQLVHTHTNERETMQMSRQQFDNEWLHLKWNFRFSAACHFVFRVQTFKS